jgi:hypothetical protein
MDRAGTVDEDIRRLIDRAIDPEFVGRLVADPEGVIRANGWSIAPDRLVAALRSAGVAPADVEVLQSRISYSGLGRLVSSALHVGHEGHAGAGASSSRSDATAASTDQSLSTDQSASTDQSVGTVPPGGEAAPDPSSATPEAADADGDGASVPFAMDDGMKGMKAAPVDGVPDESGD